MSLDSYDIGGPMPIARKLDAISISYDPALRLTKWGSDVPRISAFALAATEKTTGAKRFSCTVTTPLLSIDALEESVLV